MAKDDFYDAMLAALQPRLDEADAAWVLEIFAPIRAAASAPRTVLQDWVSQLSMMQQSVLLTAVRGPDGLPKYHPVKYLLRWYRRCTLLSSFLHQVIDNPVVSDGGSFLGPSVRAEDLRCLTCARRHEFHDIVFVSERESGHNDHKFVDGGMASWEPGLDDIVTQYIAALDEVPHHFQLHLLHAIEILGYKHPDPAKRAWWLGVYTRLVHDMHLWPESEQELDRRLGDSREGWLARGDVATNA